MDDSSINPILLSSSAHLENVEQLIKNLEKQTLDLDNFEDIISNRHRQDIITKSFSSVLSSTMAIDDFPDDNFLLKSISLTNPGGARTTALHDGTVSTDSLFNQRDLFENDDLKKQRTPPAIDQSLSIDQDGAFTWDDQYDTRANYRLTFSTDKPPQAESKKDKHHRHKHHHHHRHHHRHRHRSSDSPTTSMNSDEGLSGNNMNDWSMQSSFNALEQLSEQRDHKPPVAAAAAAVAATTVNTQPPTFIRSQSHPTSFSPQQQLPNNTHSPNSSTTSSSSSASWKRMKDSQRTTSGIETKEARPPSPLSLYKIFQQKSQMAASSSSTPRSAFQYYRQQTDSIVPNHTDSMTISGERMLTEKPKSSQHQRRPTQIPRSSSSQTNSSNDQAIQTSMFLDSSSNSPMPSRHQPTPSKTMKSESYDQLSTRTTSDSPHHLPIPARPSPTPISSSSIHKSLPDLAFISQYSKEIPRSRTTSPSPPTSVPPATSASMNSTNNSTMSPTILQQQKQDSDRPRTLKSIKRYKNDRHSTEPLGVFYSPQLRKTFAAVPASAVINGSNDTPTVLKMRLPPPSSFPSKHQQASNLKSCLKYGSRANSCDIQAMLHDRRSPAPAFIIPEPSSNKTSDTSSSKRRSSEADAPPNRPDALWPSNDSNSHVLQDSSEEHHSDFDFNSFQQNQAKKSVSFSENIAKHLISPCNPAIQFDPPPEPFLATDLLKVFGGNKENSSNRVTARYGEMRRCQTDVIVVDRIQHLHSFTESPPNEFRFQDTDSLAPDHDDEDDQMIMNNAHVNILPNSDQPMPITSTNAVEQLDLTMEKMTSSNDKENKTPEQSIVMNASTTTIIPTNDPTLDGLLVRVSNIVKGIFEIKRSEKAFFLTNENNTQLDGLLKNDLCPFVQSILEHGLKPQRKDQPTTKQGALWKIIETSIDSGQSRQVFHDAKQSGQKASPYWLYQFQAFIFALLNKNELINWLYRFMQQKDILQRYYQPPDALIFASNSATFNLFERIMAQLEKLSPLAFRLVYKPAAIPSNIEEQLVTSTISTQSTKSSARDWVMRRTSRTSTQPIPQLNPPPTASATHAADTIRSTLSRKINSLFTKTATTQPPRQASSTVTAKLPTAKPQSVRQPSPATRRTGPSNVFANATAAAATANKPVIVSSPKLNHGTRTGTMRRGISPSVVVAPSPPPILNTTGTTPSTTFQSKIPRPSLNVDKPKSARYRSTAPPPK